MVDFRKVLLLREARRAISEVYRDGIEQNTADVVLIMDVLDEFIDEEMHRRMWSSEGNSNIMLLERLKKDVEAISHCEDVLHFTLSVLDNLILREETEPL